MLSERFVTKSSVRTSARMNDEMGLDIAKAIPTVIEGKKHTIKHMIDGKCLTVKFNTKNGSFTIEAVVQPLE